LRILDQVRLDFVETNFYLPHFQMPPMASVHVVSWERPTQTFTVLWLFYAHWDLS